MIGEPPSFAGAVHETAIDEPDAMETVTPVGACGTPRAVTELDATDAEDVPMALVAVTVKVYESPPVNPVTVHVVAPVVVQVCPPLAELVESDAITV